MSVNLFIKSSILNCSTRNAIRFKEYCEEKLDNPQISFDESGDLIILEDFDRRHIRLLLEFLEL